MDAVENSESLLRLIDGWVWGLPLLILLFGTGLYLTILLRGVQFRYLGYAFTQIYAEQKKDAKGDINSYEALMTSLAGAIGTGAIVGVSTGLVIGGVGALFWMWITAILGMATKYAESLLAIKYRDTDAKGEMIGGPMQYIEKGIKMKWLAVLFAGLGSMAAFGTGNLIQVNSIAEAANHIFDVNPWVTGICLSVITGAVIIGGIQSIGRVAGVLVPFMALLYVGAGGAILLYHWSAVPGAFWLIISSAFDFSSLAGGFFGSAFLIAIQSGASRSVFSNEAGMGISAIAAAAAKVDSPGRQAMITMTGALLSTVVVCTITGLVLIVTGVLGPDVAAHMSGAGLAIKAFNTVLPAGSYIVTIGLVLFAFTTVLAWAYYGEKCFEYLFGTRGIIIYRIIFCLAIIPGAALKLEVAWSLSNIANGLMAIPNLIALIALSKVIVQETKEFLLIIAKESATPLHNESQSRV